MASDFNFLQDIDHKKIDPPNPSTWKNETDKNYQYASQFYQQRKVAFLSYLDKNINETAINKITLDLKEIFSKVWSKGVLKALEIGAKGDFQQGADILFQINEEYDLNLNYENLLKTYTSNKSALGFDYEKVIASLLNKYFTSLSEKTSKLIGNNINALLINFSQMEGTAAYSKAAHTKGVPLIRMDVGNVELEQKNKISYIKDTNITSELQCMIDIEQSRQNNEIPEALLPYLINGQFAGFSAKHMKTLINEKFSQSSIIANQIDKGLAASTQSGHRRRWHTDWAEAYSNWCLSKCLFNIIGPLDIGIISGANFYWLNEFLSSARFKMAIMEDKMDGSVDPKDPGLAYRKTYQVTSSRIKANGKVGKRTEKGKILISGFLS